MYQQYQQHALNGFGEHSEQDYIMEDDTADLTPRSAAGRARGGRSRRAAASRLSAATTAASGGNSSGYQRSGIPGKVCCECGATQTPQWREGPKGKGCRQAVHEVMMGVAGISDAALPGCVWSDMCSHMYTQIGTLLFALLPSAALRGSLLACSECFLANTPQ